MLTCSLFIYAMNQMPHVGWRDPTGAPVRLALAAARSCTCSCSLNCAHAMPILSFSLFRIRLLRRPMFSLFFITSTQSAISFLMPFYLQDVLHSRRRRWAGLSSPIRQSSSWSRRLRAGCPIAWVRACSARSDRQSSSSANFLLPRCRSTASIWRIILPLLLIGLGWALFNSPEPERDPGFGAARRSRHRIGNEHDHGAHRRSDGRRAFSNFVHLWARAAGLSRAQIESPQTWGDAPEIFVHSFNHTVHVVNFFTILSVFFSAVRGPRHENPTAINKTR